MERDLLAQARWLCTLLKKLNLIDYTRIHVQGMIIRGRVVGKNNDMKGFADLEVVVPPLGRVGYMELKWEDGKLSEDQKAFRDSRVKMGCHWAAPRTFEEVVQFFRDMGVNVDGVLKGLKPGNINGRRALNDSSGDILFS